MSVMNEPLDDERTGGLLAWQRAGYPVGHTQRRNLILHALTVPLFWAGTLDSIAAPLLRAWAMLPLGLVLIVAALVAQGRGHAGERQRPVPFRGPADFVARFFVEQWITFPRFVLSGGFARAWRASHDAVELGRVSS
jgi:hypothetical protein